MRPTEILSQEHQVILKVLDCLERIADCCQSSMKIDVGPAREALEFFRLFADRCHHLKEEHRLFPALVRKGFPSSDGPIFVMNLEHEQGRRYVRQMDDAIERHERGEAGAPAAFVSHARAYVVMLREHIAKEDHCLFPMVDQALDANAQREVVEAFEQAERDDLGEGTHERLLAVASQLCERYGVDMLAAGARGSGNCCHH
ncbi:MAG: hemerythrin domain-containing protein [Planctomycetota bacterium]